MIPSALEQWSYEMIVALCERGRSESDRHDFKFNLPDPANLTKLCCAFANTFGGFIVLGVRDRDPTFEVVGTEPDKEIYGKFLGKLKAEPDIQISSPKLIPVPDTQKTLYVFEVPRSTRRPHLPNQADQRIFWKRQGSDCVQMTLEEIRYQMNSYEEKIEKLALLSMDLRHKVRSVEIQATVSDGQYNADIYSFEIIDRVVVEAFSLLKVDTNIFGALDTFRSLLMQLNSKKRHFFQVSAMSYENSYKLQTAVDLRQSARDLLPHLTTLADQIERSLRERFGVVNPFGFQLVATPLSSASA